MSRGTSALRYLAYAAAGVPLILLGVSYLADRAAGTSLPEPVRAENMIERGAYLAALGDCAACHSTPGRPPFSGGLRMAIPVGAIYTTNITPDNEHGIGTFSLTDFDRALRYGVSRGHTLYPAMPFTSYYNTQPADVTALYEYFKYGVAPAAVPNRRNELMFPLSMRWPLSFWRMLFASSPHPFAAASGTDPAWARGAYFIEGLGHCGECHTPRSLFMSMQARTAADGPTYLSGAAIEGYFAPSLRSGGPGTLGDWSLDDLAQFLRTGANRQGITFASMSDVIVHSTRHLTTDDARSAALYLKSLRDGVPSEFVYDAADSKALRAGSAGKRGALLYLNNCAACHRPDGRGYERVFPQLAGNPVVQARSSQSVVSIILQGAQTPRTETTMAQFTMPAFAWRLSDQDVADIASFVRTSWGNRSSQVTALEVKGSRKRLNTER
jgi:alcohol dehydrogenase (quinone), cytochrome c subunit